MEKPKELNHNYVKWMIENLPDDSGITLDQGKRDRWIGFMQGVLCMLGVTTIDECRERMKIGEAIDHIKELVYGQERIQSGDHQGTRSGGSEQE